MTLQQLTYIVETANEGSFNKAALKCHVTQPTLSVQIKKLEDEIGITLFIRNSKPLKLTSEGELIVAKARSILEDMNTLDSYAKKKHLSLEGHYTIGIIPTLATYILPIFMKVFNDNYPETKFTIREMHTNSLVNSMLNDEVDIGILVTPLNEKKLREIPMFNERFLVYTSKTHQLYNAEKVNKSHLTENGLLLLEEGHCFRDQTLDICGFSKMQNKKITYQSGSIETLMRIIDVNKAYTLVPELSVLTNKSDNIKHFEEPVPVREISLVVRNTFSKEKLIQTIRQEITDNLPTNVKKIEKFFRVSI
jgi:LysR family hydrogen peroxide-inducible transcriptional activator